MLLFLAQEGTKQGHSLFHVHLLDLVARPKWPVRVVGGGTAQLEIREHTPKQI